MNDWGINLIVGMSPRTGLGAKQRKKIRRKDGFDYVEFCRKSFRIGSLENDYASNNNKNLPRQP